MRKLAFLSLMLFANNLFAVQDPFDTVQKATDDLLSRLVEVQPLYASSPEKFFAEVDATLAPFVDFAGFSGSVMAKYKKQASVQQKTNFQTIFRKQLIETYSVALLGFDNEEVVVLKPNAPQRKPDKAKVSLEVHSNDGQVYKIDYSLRLIDARWQLRNIVINGINIGKLFRSQFAVSMGKYKGDIDSVIENWAVDV